MKYSARNNANALHVELDLSVIDADNAIGGTINIWGVALADLNQSNDLAGKSIVVQGGMQPGLPLATAQAKDAGVICSGTIYRAFGTWEGTNMFQTLVIVQGPSDKPAQPNAPNPPPKTLVLNWLKGKPMADAVKQALQTAYPSLTLNINISPKLVAPQDNVGYYAGLKELNMYLRTVSQQIMKGVPNYPGVGLCIQQGELTVHDGTASPSPKMLEFTSLIGQPVWIDVGEIQIRTVMRGGLKLGDLITLPPTRVITTVEAQSGPATPLTFQGTFRINTLRHIGNCRSPDGAAWCTNIDAFVQA